MDPIAILNKEHEEFIAKIREFKSFVDNEEVNVPVVSHMFKGLANFWNNHEEKEERFFRALEAEGIEFPVKKFVLEHRELRGHKKVINDAINFGHEDNILIALDTDGEMLTKKLRAHINAEEAAFKEIPKEKLEVIGKKLDKTFNISYGG